MIKFRNDIVKYFLFEKSINHKDLELIFLLDKFKKITKYSLERKNIYIKNLKKRIINLNSKLGFEYVIKLPEGNKETFKINDNYINLQKIGYTKIPFDYENLKKLNKDQMQILILILFFTRTIDYSKEYKTNSIPISVIKSIFTTYKQFLKLFSDPLTDFFLYKDIIQKHYKKTKDFNFIVCKIKLKTQIKEDFDIEEILAYSGIDENIKQVHLSGAEIIEKIKESLRKDGTISATMNKIFGIYMLENDISNIKDLLSFKNFENDILQFKKELFLLEVI